MKESKDIFTHDLKVQEILRGAVLTEIGVASGKYLELWERKDMKSKVGTLPYTYFRISKSFPKYLLRNYFFKITSEGNTVLKNSRLLILKNLKALRLRDGNKIHPTYSNVLKILISEDPDPFNALYSYAETRKNKLGIGELEKIHKSILDDLGGEIVGKKEEWEKIIGVAKVFDAFVDAAKVNKKADFRKLTESIDNVENPLEFLYQFAKLSNTTTARLYESKEWVSFGLAKKVLDEVGYDVGSNENEDGSITLNQDVIRGMIQKIADWNNNEEKSYQRFMNKVKYDLLARNPKWIGD